MNMKKKNLLKNSHGTKVGDIIYLDFNHKKFLNKKKKILL